MSARPRFTPYSVVTNGSMAADITSAVTIIQNLSMISYDIAWSAGASPVGVLTVEVSNTYAQYPDGSVQNAGRWTTVVLSSPMNVSGNSGTVFADIDANAAFAMRLKYTRTSGSGTLNATVNGKVM